MANCNDMFQDFKDKISIPKTKREHLKKGKDGIETRIKNYYKNENENQPTFCQQGSYALNTMINPLDEEYDLDDGVYLQHLDDKKDNWPTTEIVHKEILEAVEKHTDQKNEDLKSCIRVVYAGDYHIDLPIYGEYGGRYFLARTGDEQWVENDIRGFNEWSRNKFKDSEQLRSIVKYLKAWNDFKNGEFTGILITVLVGQYHEEFEDRDDESLAKTVQRIIANFKVNRKVLNPVDSKENLIEKWSDSKIGRAIEALENLHEKALEAINEKDKAAASKKWITVFGTRFPEYEEEKEESKVAVIPLVRDTRSPAPPWSQS